MAGRARLPLGREPVPNQAGRAVIDGASCLIGSCQAIPSRLLTIAWNAAPRLRPPWLSGAAAARFSSIDAATAVLWVKSSRDSGSRSPNRNCKRCPLLSERGCAAFPFVGAEIISYQGPKFSSVGQGGRAGWAVGNRGNVWDAQRGPRASSRERKEKNPHRVRRAHTRTHVCVCQDSQVHACPRVSPPLQQRHSLVRRLDTRHSDFDSYG